MSSLPDPSQRLSVSITAADSATEIFLLDSQLHLVDRGLGSLTTEQTPGLYQVKLRAGLQTREELIALRDQPFHKAYEPLSFASPAPLSNTAKTHEFHERNAVVHSDRVNVEAGDGSAIYVFARDWTGQAPSTVTSGPYPHPARGLKLRDLSGALVADFEQSSATSLQWEPWAACNVKLAPGIYLLTLDAPDGSSFQRTLVAVPEWQTQCFLLQRQYRDEKAADIAGGAVLLRRMGTGFDPYSSQLRLTELARLGLTNHRPVLSQELEDMLRGKFEDPMLGIYGGYLLLDMVQSGRHQRAPDLLQEAVRNLRSLLNMPHPDVEALAWQAGIEDRSYQFRTPPMLRKSWGLITNASADWPDAIPRDSLCAQIADRLIARDPWLVWSNDRPDDSAEENTVEWALQLYLKPRGRRHRSESPTGTEPSLDAIEFADIPSEDLPSLPGNLISPPPMMESSTFISEDMVKAITQDLNLPRSVVEEVLPRVMAKIREAQQ